MSKQKCDLTAHPPTQDIIYERTKPPQGCPETGGGEVDPRGAKGEENGKGGMKRQPIDLALDTKGLTSNAARNPFPQFYWPFRTPHFKGKDLNSET